MPVLPNGWCAERSFAKRRFREATICPSVSPCGPGGHEFLTTPTPSNVVFLPPILGTQRLKCNTLRLLRSCPGVFHNVLLAWNAARATRPASELEVVTCTRLEVRLYHFHAGPRRQPFEVLPLSFDPDPLTLRQALI